jgi:predicted membrane-bound dolichyl-phosphate-mannose-protein mannosyltransferase
MSASARLTARSVAAQTWFAPMLVLLVGGFVVRMLFIGASGFHNDISAFEAWSLVLTEHPLNQFYASTSFADYPPGYFFVLLGIGWFYKGLIGLHLIAPASYGVLAKLVKIPAIAMDLVDTWLIFALVRRYASERIALVAAGFFAFNPAAIYISAYWGQIDSVSWGLVLFGLLMFSRASQEPRVARGAIVWAWLAVAFSILIKPQAAFVFPLYIAFAFTGSLAERRARLEATGIGMLAGVVMAYVSCVVFHGSWNPVADFAWLLHQYTYGSGVYAENTVNAFNLYAVKQPFWQPDSQPLTFFGLAIGPMVVWGWGLVIGSTALIVARYVQRKDDAGFFEAAMLIAFAFFCLATRMHERYLFGAFLLMMPLIGFGRRYLWAAVIVSCTLFANLAYSLNYQTVLEDKIPGLNPFDLWPLISHPASALNVLTFFTLGYLFLGGTIAYGSAIVAGGAQGARRAGEFVLPAFVRVRNWFDTREGLATMTRTDYLIAGALTLASFVICILWYGYPEEKYFDEVYYPRAGEEYLSHKPIFEYTHPPLTKLIITLSMMMFGGLHGLGNTGYGWRFLNVVIGALMVFVLYLFAKRLTRSTLFASAGALMLTFDGFHYVQSRIATPEITVAFFSLLTIYAFYRWWIATQVAVNPRFDRPRLTQLGTILLIGLIPSALFAAGLSKIGPTTTAEPDYTHFLHWSWFVSGLWFETLIYVVARLVLPRIVPTAREVSYADGTLVADGPAGALTTPEGILRDAGTAPAARSGRGAGRPAKGDVLAYDDGDGAKRSYDRDNRLIYATPAGTTTFTPAGAMETPVETVRAKDAWFWLGMVAVSAAALSASKWNGLFDVIMIWLIAGAVFLQRYLKRPALFGNPFGTRITLLAGWMYVIGGLVYTACYIPFFTLGNNFVDMVALQHGMYWYHSTLKATHLYQSSWWQWPFIGRPISYYYHDFRAVAAQKDPAACCVAEILALPNPLIWWSGMLTVPIVAVLAWTDKNKGYALLAIAYFLQWLPWIGSPRIAFEYHFFPNLAIIVLANAIVLQRIWQFGSFGKAAAAGGGGMRLGAPQWFVIAYLVAAVALFWFFYPIIAGVHVSWDAWHARIWFPSWI